ncbi:hypothetical protein CDAR_473951 [Caerostris darwini]|uniref:Uncharacterized protein n=1 Tax=Caerostris darwini TaxID=1538125 RepID=A0AAV4SH24_9ARAC|nr:hypothetical protein CDAR_473861 [Caerostris darwini]GIY33435.1 hypothetical protein CDAR_473951 [Caerostris darwini]
MAYCPTVRRPRGHCQRLTPASQDVLGQSSPKGLRAPKRNDMIIPACCRAGNEGGRIPLPHCLWGGHFHNSAVAIRARPSLFGEECRKKQPKGTERGEDRSSLGIEGGGGGGRSVMNFEACPSSVSVPGLKGFWGRIFRIFVFERFSLSGNILYLKKYLFI